MVNHKRTPCSSHEDELRSKRPKFKHIACLNMQEHGSCKYEDKCSYSHTMAACTADWSRGLTRCVSKLESDIVMDNRGALEVPETSRVATYSWLSTESKAIAVPGQPRQLHYPATPFHLRPDIITEHESDAASQETAKPSRFRFAAPIEAIQVVTPSFEFHDIGAIAGLGALKKLISFFRGEPGPFRLDLELVGNTLFLCRWEEDPCNIARQSKHKGYGQAFETICTRREAYAPRFSSYHRVVRLGMKGLNLLIDHEVDAYDCTCAGKECCSAPVPIQDGDEEVHQQLQILKQGSHIRDSCLVEIKSREVKNVKRSDMCLQIWLSGITRLILGRHSKGLFADGSIREHDVTREVLHWAEGNRRAIRKMKALLTTIRDEVKAQRSLSGVTKWAVVHTASAGHLELWIRSGGQEMVNESCHHLFREWRK